MKNCYSCIHKDVDGSFIWCGIDIPNDVFELSCEHTECPYWEGEEE